MARWRRIEVIAIKLSFQHGQCEYQHPEYEVDDVFIVWGGVLAQLALLLLALSIKTVVLALWPPLYYTVLQPPLTVFITVNIVIAVLNLLPIASLDGARVACGSFASALVLSRNQDLAT